MATTIPKAKKIPAPTPQASNPRDKQWRKDGTDVGSSIEDSSRQRAFFLWEPLGHSFQASGKTPASLKPSPNRTTINPEREFITPCAMDARLQPAIAKP